MPIKLKKEEMIGQKSKNYQGLEMVVDVVNDYSDIVVRFLGEYKDVRNCSYGHFKTGSVKNRYFPEIYGVAYIGNTTSQESPYTRKKSYLTWNSMIKRCYSVTKKDSSYANCSVCKEWLCFENFEKWYNENYYTITNEKICIDKDILVRGNRIYSPTTCLFVPERINNLFIYKKNKDSNLPIGVVIRKNKGIVKYISKMNIDGKETHLGAHNTIEGAFDNYKKKKENNIKRIANIYKNNIPQKLYNILMEYEVFYEY